jgi:hypothetical protein
LYVEKSGLACCLHFFLEWLALYFSFFSGVVVQFAQSSDYGKQGPIPAEMSQTLLTNKKQGNLDLVHAANIIKPT